MGIIGIIALLVVLILIGVGIAIGLIACLIAAALLGLGVISSSFLIGIRSKKPAAGIRAFWVQCGILAGIPSGIVCAWLILLFIPTENDSWPVYLVAASAGAVAGLIIALTLDFVTREIHRWASERLKKSDDKKLAAS